MGAGGVRHGQAAGVQISMLSFDEDNSPYYHFTGKELLSGETDGSSYPHGGLRATHTAGGYLVVDPVSPPFVRGDCLFIPAAFISYTGMALDEKTPLHRACAALSNQGCRMLKALGVDSKGLICNIGLEQEFFLVPRESYYARPDLQYAGRTLLGAPPARGQEMSDHYMAPTSQSTAALACLQEVQEECFRLGIPLKTRHREVAPGQYELVPLFGDCRVESDRNLILMQIIEETAAKFGLSALLNEKPFDGINGSGKHNNWSFATVEGLQLLNPSQAFQKTGSPHVFPAAIAAVVRGVHKYGDLMRQSIATPGNDFRLGGMEAPPVVISTYLGTSLADYLQRYIAGEEVGAYAPAKHELPFGVGTLPRIRVPSEDRNRTSPFPYGGNRFEFRAAGSSQNMAPINTVLNTLTAEGMKVIADRIEAGEGAQTVIADILKSSWASVFNGDGYSASWPEEAKAKGLWSIASSVDAISSLTSEKNVALFESMGVLTADECEARQNVCLSHYLKTVEVEASSLKEMIKSYILPACAACGVESRVAHAPTDAAPTMAALETSADALEEAVAAIDELSKTDLVAAAREAHDLRLGKMLEIRRICDSAEVLCRRDVWPLAQYKDLLFLDTHPSFDTSFAQVSQDFSEPMA